MLFAKTGLNHLALAAVMVGVTHAATCDNSTYTVSLDGLRCPHLKGDATAKTPADCIHACCTSGLANYTGICDTWQFHPDDGCLVGGPEDYDMTQCVAAGSGWTGARRFRVPELVPRPQRFVPSPAALGPLGGATLPLWSLDLASATAWRASVDGAMPRGIVVPGGGYSSDLQEKPWINACQDPSIGQVADNVTYTRVFTIDREAFSAAAGGGAPPLILLEFGAVNHGAEVFLDGQLVGVHYGPLMPFGVDVTAALLSSAATGSSSPPLSSHELSVVAFHPRRISWVPTGFIYDEVGDRACVSACLCGMCAPRLGT